ncbi:transcription factor bHLH111 [Cornus florida]|uniref:transcription factor bHLH111 n=1 Tax=Cornus florida TaxID=4283 RepID=UPI0028A12536|nr:transcription factor bHLH111 [Cornus florida]
MAELECTESSIATTISSTPNWWPDLHANSLSSWSSSTTNTNQWHPQNPNSNSSCEEDVSISTSFTNASNHSGLSVDSSRRFIESAPANELIGEAASDNHLWSHVLLSVGSSGELHNSQDVRENLLDIVPPKNLSTGMFEPAFDYLKKMDNSWEFTNPSSFNNFEKQFNGFNETLIESERLNKLSNLVSNWSLAPPDPEVNHQFDPNNCHMKQTISSDSTISCKGDINRNFGSLPCYGHDMKVENELQEVEAPNGALFRRSFNSSNGIGYQMGLNNSVVGDNMKYYYGMPDVPCTNARSFADVISFGSNCLSKPLVDIHAPKPNLKSSNLSDCKKQDIQNSPQFQQPTISKCHTLTRNNGRGQGITNEGKKKRSEENSDTVQKKPKQESSTVTSVKMQGPKVKLGDKITALQQIVSPFGKTDTASVLWEAINYIRCLQEQVQLLSNPYLKTNASKDSWGGMDRKDRGEAKLDLKSRGLCLVPISCTPQVYRDNTAGSDYWTPAYRGCLYR